MQIQFQHKILDHLNLFLNIFKNINFLTLLVLQKSQWYPSPPQNWSKLRSNLIFKFNLLNYNSIQLHFLISKFFQNRRKSNGQENSKANNTDPNDSFKRKQAIFADVCKSVNCCGLRILFGCFADRIWLLGLPHTSNVLKTLKYDSYIIQEMHNLKKLSKQVLRFNSHWSEEFLGHF